jgi:CRISPR-associated endonuclease Cas1
MDGGKSNAVKSASAWADRCRHWVNTPVEKRAPGRPPRRRHEPLILTGHGMRLNVENGALVVHGGFTHYPQAAQEWRFFPGDPQLPSRIVVLDGSGSLSIGVLDWLAAQKLPLIRIDWRGTVQAVVAGTVLGTDPRKVTAQIEAQRTGRGLAIGATLIRDKIENSIATLEAAVPSSPARAMAISKLRHDVAELRKKPPRSIRELLGVEGRAATAYFSAWQGVPIRWKGIGRRPIPQTWHRIEPRSTAAKRKITNRNASHPVNAILNYAYAVLEGQVRMHIVAQGYDPNIGYLHASTHGRPAALVFDLMEPLRPIVDRSVLQFVQSHTFHAADFAIRSDGVCRLNPEMAAHVVRVTTNRLGPAVGCLS